MRKTINGQVFEGMMTNALHNLLNAEKEINSMNVFPVADGDTGSNMRLTLQHGVNNAKSTDNLGDYLKRLSNGMLLGARGNSGVILSQLFKGMYRELHRCSIVNAREFKDAFIRAYKEAYQAVVNPVEGTILTVSRVAAENVRGKLNTNEGVEGVFKLYLNEMESAILETPNQLKVLKEANVLDSGAKGYIVIVEGMYKYLNDEIIEPGEDYVDEKVEMSPILFDENSSFIDGYCTEFLLQLLNEKNYLETFNLDEFIEYLKPLGNSLVCLQEESIVKVHIHTLDPSKVIAKAREYGEFISFKMENMQIQHNEYSLLHEQQDMDHRDVIFISCLEGEGIKNFFKELGVDHFVPGGQSHNPSAQAFVSAINNANANHIVIFPNNPNIIETANQAKQLSPKKDIIEIVPTKSIIDGYTSIAMDVPDEEFSMRVSSLKDGVDVGYTITISRAVKDYSSDEVTCHTGDEVICVNDKVKAAGNNPINALKEALSKIEDIESRGAAMIFLNEEFDNLEAELEKFFAENYPNLEVNFVLSSGMLYEAIIGVI